MNEFKDSTYKLDNRDKIIVTIKAFLASFAVNTSFLYPEITGGKSLIYRIKDAVLEASDIRNFTFVCTWLAFGFLFAYCAREHVRKASSGKGVVLTSVFFALIVWLGQGYTLYGSAICCFCSGGAILKSLLAAPGFFFLFKALIGLFFVFLDNHAGKSGDTTGFWSRNVFLRSFAVILLFWLPIIILSFPGNLNWDTSGEIDQVILGGSVFGPGYNTHHPIVYTLIVGNMVKLGGYLFGSYNAGLFLYMIVQITFLISSLSFSLAALAKRHPQKWVLNAVLGFYYISPVFSNIATTAIKDVPYVSCVIFYVVMVADFLEEKENISVKMWIAFAMSQFGIVIFRKNGLPAIFVAAIVEVVFILKKRYSKEFVRRFIISTVGAVMAAELLSIALAGTLHAIPGSKGEIFSIPFQQTARVMKLHGEKISAEDLVVLDKVFDNLEELGPAYNYYSADPSKSFFRKDTSNKDLAEYFKLWFRTFFRYPGEYFEAFVCQTYSWFDPMVSGATRYDVRYDETVFDRNEIIPGVDQLLITFYDVLDRIAPFNLIQSDGFAVWLLILLALYEKKRGYDGSYRTANAFLWVSLLICLASPKHDIQMRYAFPYLFTIPFMYAFMLTGVWKTENNKKNIVK